MSSRRFQILRASGVLPVAKVMVQWKASAMQHNAIVAMVSGYWSAPGRLKTPCGVPDWSPVT